VDVTVGLGHVGATVGVSGEGAERLEKVGLKVLSSFGGVPSRGKSVLREEVLHDMLALERRRAERSRKPFVLMLLDSSAAHTNGHRSAFVEQLTSTICDVTRETDLVGWYQAGVVLAVIFTEIALVEDSPVTDVVRSKVVRALEENLDPRLAASLCITMHEFPENWNEKGRGKDRSGPLADIKLYPDVSKKVVGKRFSTKVKQGIDTLGSALLLLLLSPILGAIALAIKLTSKGPVIYRQQRLGQFGKCFTLLKFRTMYADISHQIHRDYVQNFIAGRTPTEDSNGNEPIVYKITNDPRITPVGRVLRRMSFDELPQFWNVLRGEMSLVGPRPPLAYEFEAYDYWHRRRVLEVKPGVTGLWQVSGRSRTCFDDMVRLDVRYSQTWSLWLDLKILLATPLAVFTGNGAY